MAIGMSLLTQLLMAMVKVDLDAVVVLNLHRPCRVQGKQIRGTP